jgi:dihydroorotate dehydrogenase
VACGGIFSGADALRAVRAGADLVQLLTALVWRGPGTPGMVCRELVAELRRAGSRSLAALRGQDLLPG